MCQTTGLFDIAAVVAVVLILLIAGSNRPSDFGGSDSGGAGYLDDTGSQGLGTGGII